MGGCVASKLEEEEEVVSICRQRKRQLKLAVERRYALSDAHHRYCQSLYGVSAALNLFVARHSQPSFLITFPPPSSSSPPSNQEQEEQEETVVTNPLFLQQTPSEPTKVAIGGCDTFPSSCSDSSEDEREQHQNHQQEKTEEDGSRYFYMGMPPPMPSPQRDFEWDFFNPFDGVRQEVMSGYHRTTEDYLRVVRQEEGIPELEEEEEAKKVVAEANQSTAREYEEERGAQEEVVTRSVESVSHGEQKGLSVIDTPDRGRELLEALKDIEDYFMRAYDSGKDLSRMLEANRVHFQSGLNEIKDNSTKIIQAITWRSPSSRSSSCKSLVGSSSKSSSSWTEMGSSSKSSSTWTEFTNDLFDDYGGMNSGSHSLTLGRLYAWEKKLYEEVKDGDSIRRIYEKKCNQLQNQDVRGDDGSAVDKTRAAVKDLYSRILVTIRSAESISERIEKLIDEELHPQILELLQGLADSWKIMLESHEIQKKIISEVKSYTSPAYAKFCSNSHRLATLQLEAELQNWRARFIVYIASQKAYIEALHGWLSKFVVPEVELYSGGRSSAQGRRINGPQLYFLCQDWLACMEKLPDHSVAFSMKSLGKDIKALWAHQGVEHKQKRKVDSLAKELDRKIIAFQKAENRVFELKLTENNTEPDAEQRADNLKQNKDLVDDFRTKVGFEKERHHKYMQESERITLNGFQSGFLAVFESLTEFCKASLKMYSDLLNQDENAGKVETLLSC